MKKLCCDRCGKEIKPRSILRRHQSHETFLRAEFNWWGTSNNHYDLCYDCYSELKKFMNDPTTYHLDYPGTNEQKEEVNEE